MSLLEEAKREYASAKSADLSAKLQEISVAQFEVESLPKQRQVRLLCVRVVQSQYAGKRQKSMFRYVLPLAVLQPQLVCRWVCLYAHLLVYVDLVVSRTRNPPGNHLIVP